jgi:hypothetical protein
MVIESLKIPLNPEIATDCTDGDLAQDPLQVGFAWRHDPAKGGEAT